MTGESNNGSPRQRRRRLRESFDHQKEEQLDAAHDERERERARRPAPAPAPGWTIWPRAWPWWQRAFATLVLVLAVVCVAFAIGVWLEWISFHLGRGK